MTKHYTLTQAPISGCTTYFPFFQGYNHILSRKKVTKLINNTEDRNIKKKTL